MMQLNSKIKVLFFVFLSLFIQGCIADETELDLTSCEYLPEFFVLHKKLKSMPTKDASKSLENYLNTYYNPAGCEYLDIVSLLEKYEKQMFQISAGDTNLKSQRIYRCDKIDLRTTHCDGPIADETAHSGRAGIPKLASPSSRDFIVKSLLPEAKLISVHVHTIRKIINNESAMSIESKSNTITLPPDLKDKIIIIIYSTKGKWPYRKVVWYF